MLRKVYLAECSDTYRLLLSALLKPYSEEVLDLWENPAVLIEEKAENLIMVDEEYLAKGPGPARSTLLNLMYEGRITQIPIILLERREKKIPFKLSPRAFRLRRPFETQSLENIFQQLGIQAQFPEREVIMEKLENQNHQAIAVSAESGPASGGEVIETMLTPVINDNLTEKIEAAIRQALEQANLTQMTQEAIEKNIREIVPSLAEKLIKEEIERLTK